ncbi:MAG TPA: MaoC family dehydratase N-terminal domain-containing protein [Solirubrobacteraceae bacterium]|jgi:3-methylfumaryl-CoA hydratase
MTELPAVASWIGRQWQSEEILVTRHDIRRYAYATRATNPVHVDVEAATAAGYADLVAPPTFCIALRALTTAIVPIDRMGPDGLYLGPLPPLPVERAMAGETRLEFHADIVAGDGVVIRTRIEDIYSKTGRSGQLYFVVFERHYETRGGVLASLERSTSVFR